MSTLKAPDLSQRPPRSPRVKLGGFVILPRALDKGRAKAAGTPGEYHYACPLDKAFFDFVKIDGEALFEQIQAGKGDWAILEWIHQNGGHKPTAWEIHQWSAYQETRTQDSIQAKERVIKAVSEINKDRTDILTRFDLLDLDDHVTFGGVA